MEKPPLPKIIYHYTTQDGLTGIIKEGALWATQIHYMNDASELVEPFRIAHASLTELATKYDCADGKHEDVREYINEIRHDLSGWKQVNICLASFCTDGDLLSQWRGYGTVGSSYSIGFDLKKLAEAALPYNFEFRQSQYYDQTMYKKRIHQFISDIVDKAKSENHLPEDFIDDFIKMAATMKFKCFAEENEWRLVSRQPIPFTDKRLNFRPSKSMIIPYYSLPLDLFSIVEIIVGPCQHPELAQNAVYGLAEKHQMKNIRQGKVITSQIPYRIF